MKRNVQPIPGRYWATSFIMAFVPYIRRECGGMLDHDQIDTAPPTNSQLMASVLRTYIQRGCTYVHVRTMRMVKTVWLCAQILHSL